VGALFWTILTVVLAVVVLLLIVAGPTFAGRTSLGDVTEIKERLWSGLWNKDDADRLR
jgi:hypothetical protein